MTKFGNNVQTIITVFLLWGDFIDIASRKGKTKKGSSTNVLYSLFYYISSIDLQGNQMKVSTISTITKSLPITFGTLVNYSLLAALGFVNLFSKKYSLIFKELRINFAKDLHTSL